MAERRIHKELSDLRADPPTLFTCGPTSSDIFDWKATLSGPRDSPYAGGTFSLSVQLPWDYPLSPPQLRFATRIYHPNIDRAGGVQLAILGARWSPSLSVATVLRAVAALLSEPETEDASEPEIARLCTSEPERFGDTAREWTRRYAQLPNGC